MEYLVTAQEMKRYDQMTIEQIGIPGLVLMERAALGVRLAMSEQYGVLGGKSALIVVGTGNNGADGLALARLLTDVGCKVRTILVGNKEKATEQWKCQAHILSEIGICIDQFEEYTTDRHTEYDFVIDALFGVGLSRDVEGDYAKAITCMNQKTGHKVALDLPSGIHTDRGDVMAIAFRADLTVTFQFVKLGLCLYPGVNYAGKVVVKDVGIRLPQDEALLPQVITTHKEPAELMPSRNPGGNKGTFGKVLVVAGGVNMAGAAVLAGSACYRTGAGMVKIISPEENREIIQRSLPEALYGADTDLTESLKWADLIIIGPGLGKNREAYERLEQVISESDKPVVIDADGLNLLAENPSLQQILKESLKKGRECILTPHVGELVRLVNGTVKVLAEKAEKNEPFTIQTVKKDISTFAFALAKDYHCTVVAKDARTFICKEGKKTFLNLRGNDGMAVAGSGDVLAGIIGGLLGQGLTDYEAAFVGVLLHGRMGEKAALTNGRQGMLAGDMVGQLGPYFAKYFS